MIDRQQLPTGPGDYGPDIYTNFVCNFIQEHRHEPFLFYYPMALIHPPLEATPDLNRPGHVTESGQLRPNVEYMDHLVGRICRTIDQSGLRDNTYVFFTGDNGTAGAGKGDVNESGARVPLIVRGPGIRPGAVSDELVDLTDILPTLAELAGAALPQDRVIDGVSMVPVLLDRPGPQREWIFSYLNDRRMLRDKRWLRDGDGQFFDCGESRDGSGYRNVTDSNDPKVQQARARFARILKDLPGPVPDPAGDR
jgi:arylsulfatase A